MKIVTIVLVRKVSVTKPVDKTLATKRWILKHSQIIALINNMVNTSMNDLIPNLETF